MATKAKTASQIMRDRKAFQAHKREKSMGLYYTTQSLMGIPWWTWAWLVGARGRGKSFAAMETYLQFRKKYGAENVRCYYFRVSDLSVKAMLADNGRKAIDAVLVRKYKLKPEVTGYTIYDGDQPLIDFYPLVSAAKKGKGVAEYDPEFLNNRPKGVKRFIFMLIDEFMTDQTQEKKTVGSPVKQFKIYFENIMRDQAQLDYRAVMVFGCANSVSECSDFLAELAGFIPEAPGRYKLKRKHMIIDQIPNSSAYMEKRKASIGADIMDYTDDENYTNVVKRDLANLKPKNLPLRQPTQIIKFAKSKDMWYTVWDGRIIKQYTGQSFKPAQAVAMRRYIDERFEPDRVKAVIDMTDGRYWLFNDLITQAKFLSAMREIKK